MKRLRNLLLAIAGFALGWWIVATLLEWMSPKPVPAEGMQTKETHPYEVSPGISPAMPSTKVVSTADDDDTSEPADTPEQTDHEPAVSENGDTGAEEGRLVYCLRCREKRPIANWRYETTEQGRRRIVGKCSVCGAGMSQFVKSE